MRGWMLGVVVVAVVLTLPAMGQVKVEIARALSAAPEDVAAHAAVARMDEHGRLTELRAGTNGWTCLPPDDPAHIGNKNFPACFDKYGLQWLEDFYAGRKPDPEHVGYSYMLQGGWSWSNTDPTARKLAPGQKDYIHIPPHVMILGARAAETSGFPSGQADPDTHAPFVMFGGTPFAILIIPVK
ncbi:MAG TPA: hypothetical protein VME86_04375 [Acidobacteriaceae bacterium]|nr:hypothetical protein [Acidobacteriaceae bacterium]